MPATCLRKRMVAKIGAFKMAVSEIENDKLKIGKKIMKSKLVSQTEVTF